MKTVSWGPRMKLFDLYRHEDETGVSGTGIVAEGVQFSDGTIAMRWLSEQTSTAIFKNVGDLRAIHGHDGKTQVVWR